jgi:protein SCO1/2
MKMLLALLVVCAVGLGALYVQTEGFSVVTTEGARRQAIAQHPRKLPAVMLGPGVTARVPLLGMLKADGRVAIVDFIYTRCLTICQAMGSEYQQLQRAIHKHKLQDRVRLISISFDPADTAADLARYGKRFGADPAVWQFYGAPDAVGLKTLLGAFGIVVVPAELGQFVHNAAYHVVTPDGRLARIVDYGDPWAALAAARRIGSRRAVARGVADGLAHGMTVGAASVAARGVPAKAGS